MGEEWLGLRGKVRLGEVRLGWERKGLAGRGKVRLGEEWLGLERTGTDWKRKG